MNIVRVHSVLIYLRHHGAQRNTHPAGQFQADTKSHPNYIFKLF